MAGFSEEQKNEMIERYRKMLHEGIAEWRSALSILFPVALPSFARWTAPDDIVAVLNTITRPPERALTHMFYPNGGGNDLDAVKLSSSEPGCIELDAGSAALAKPRELTFHSFGFSEIEWAYFRLDCELLKQSGVYESFDDDRRNYEEVTELTPGVYDTRAVWDAGEDRNGDPLSDNARTIMRFLSGSFVFFAKFSPYNRDVGVGDAYSAFHNRHTTEAFREYIQSIIQVLRSRT